MLEVVNYLFFLRGIICATCICVYFTKQRCPFCLTLTLGMCRPVRRHIILDQGYLTLCFRFLHYPSQEKTSGHARRKDLRMMVAASRCVYPSQITSENSSLTASCHGIGATRFVPIITRRFPARHYPKNYYLFCRCISLPISSFMNVYSCLTYLSSTAPRIRL